MSTDQISKDQIIIVEQLKAIENLLKKIEDKMGIEYQEEEVKKVEKEVQSTGMWWVLGY